MRLKNYILSNIDIMLSSIFIRMYMYRFVRYTSLDLLVKKSKKLIILYVFLSGIFIRTNVS